MVFKQEILKEKENIDFLENLEDVNILKILLKITNHVMKLRIDHGKKYDWTKMRPAK